MNKKLAEDLRVIAAGLRKEAVEIEKSAAVKCAQVLIAARGLRQLKGILNGGER